MTVQYVTNVTHSHSVTQSLNHSVTLLFWNTQKGPRHLWPLRNLIRVMRKHGHWTMPVTNTFKEHLQMTFYYHLVERIEFNTVNPSLSTGKDYTVHSLMMNRMAVLKTWELFICPRVESSLDSRDVPRENSWASGMDFPIPPSFWWSTAILFIIRECTV